MKLEDMDIKIVEKDNMLYVEGDLDFRRTNITELPNNLYVEGDLDLRGTPITKLPDNLYVEECLVIEETDIRVLPDNLFVGGSLYLEGTNIRVLPDNLYVGGSLHLKGTSIINYPVVYDCGFHKKAIYLDLKDKTKIRIGYFKGTKRQAIKKIKKEYRSNIKQRDEYIEKVIECFNMWKRMKNE